MELRLVLDSLDNTSTNTGKFPALRMDWREVLRPEAGEFVNQLARHFGPRIAELLEDRTRRQRQFDAGILPDFLDSTRAIREGDWRVGPIPRDLQDRRVEITGPTDRKMIINALNSGASVFMADCEDSLCPTWSNVIQGQVNLMEAVRRTLTFKSPEGKSYRLNESTAVLIVRPRGWHLPEKHWLLDGKPIPGALVDFGLLPVPQRERAAEPRQRTVFLPAEARKPSRGAAVGAGDRLERAHARHCRAAASR